MGLFANIKEAGAALGSRLQDMVTDVNAWDSEGMTPLLRAIEKEDLQAVQRLLEKGADPQRSNKYGHLPLTCAATKSNTLITGALLQKIADTSKETGTKKEIAKIQNALFFAINWKRKETVKLLLDAGADANNQFPPEFKQDQRYLGCTPLHVATSSGNNEIMQTLVAFPGVDIERRDANGFTPLHIAAHGGDVMGMLILLGAGADVNAQDKNGKTALHLAAQINYEQTAQVLLENGADPTLRDNNNQTPRDIAIKLKEEKDLPGMLEIFERMSNTPGSTVTASSITTAFAEKLHGDHPARL